MKSTRNSIGEISWIEYQILSSGRLCHGTFLRKGGVSFPPYQALNFGECIGDIPEAVLENKRRAEGSLNVPLILPNQVHGARIVEVIERVGAPYSCDGLITDRPGIAIGVRHADCQAAIFFDPKHNAIGVAHAGWRGLIQNIYGQLIDKMSARYGSRAEEIKVAVSPSLGPDHAQFVNWRKELPADFAQYRERDCYFNLWKAAYDQLEKKGLNRHNIQISPICTYCCSEDYFSFRREGGEGRHVTFASVT